MDSEKQIKKLLKLVKKQAKVLNYAKGKYSPYLDKEIEDIEIERINVLKSL